MSSAIKTPAFQAKASNILNEDNSSIYSGGEWSFKNASAVTGFHVDASGNVGIGTTNPGAPLTVYKDMGASAVFRLKNTSSTNRTTRIQLEDYSSALADGFIDFKIQTAGVASSAIMQLGVNSPAMTLDASGNCYVGRTSGQSAEKFGVATTGNLVAWFHNSTNISGYHGIATGLQPNGGNTSSYHYWANTNSVGNWYLYGNGTSSFSSDERLKKNIETARDGYVSDLCKLRVVKYNWKAHEEGTPKELGLIAQEVEKVFPGLVQEDLNPVKEDGETYKQLKSSVLPFLLLKAIQEQQAMIESMKAEIEALKAKP